MKAFVECSRIVEPATDPIVTVPVVLHVFHIVSASPEMYTSGDAPHRGCRVVLSIGKTMLLDESPTSLLNRITPRRWWQ